MNQDIISTNTSRAKLARLSKTIGKTGYLILMALATICAVLTLVVAISDTIGHALLLVSFALLFFLPAIWWKRELKPLPATGNNPPDRLSVDVLSRLKPGMTQNPQTVYQALTHHWQSYFITNRLLLPRELVISCLSTNPTDLNAAMHAATQLADNNQSPTIELGFVIAGLLMTSPQLTQELTQMKFQPSDIEAIANWLGRNLREQRLSKHNYGGVGRDWAFGFTPLLDRLGHNISSSITQHGAHYGWLTDSEGVLAIEAAMSNRNTAIALIGPDGIGKTTSVYAFAQRMIEGRSNKNLAYHQIISLNATDIVSRARGQGELEQIMIRTTNEAHHAGHIILFFDDAQLFFGGAPGAFDATQILLSIVQASAVPIILAMSPNDYQRLRVQNQSLASLLTPIMLQELPEPGIMRVLEDAAIGYEYKHHVSISYDALREAYRLSGRYEQDEAYPGKALKLLEQSIPHANQGLITALSVQQAVEQTRGVKVASAAPVEADQLLHLEDAIHQRMINQAYAVKAVASALRRARAGVTNPRRPIGSFLFLGPTGVGKTELAKAIAAIYFGAESNLLRLDMSEYQQPDDVQRLLSTGANDTSSLIMSVRQQPFSVVLFDEIEKAHPNILNLLLQLLDEGQLTDASGKPASFKDCIIIATSNAGSQTIRERVGRGEELESFAGELTDELISSGQFKPELLNRFDDTVLFRPLTLDELGQVVALMLQETNATLAAQNIAVQLTPAAISKIVEHGNDPRLGARPMRRALQRAVEDTVAQKILSGQVRPGDHVMLDAPDLMF